MNPEIQILLSERERYKTNRILHLLLCIPSFLMWGLVSLSNTIQRRVIDRKIREAGARG